MFVLKLPDTMFYPSPSPLMREKHCPNTHRIAANINIYNFLLGTQELFSIGCKPKEEYGFSYVPVVLRFCTPDNENDYFYIMRFLCIRSVSDIYDDLKKTSEYIGPAKHQVVPSDITTEPGLGLPP